MATLVQFLAAGVNGAASGTATFVLRGTASSALSVMWSDFEMTTQPASNVITLDANGAAEVYVDAYCDVTLKNSGGSTLRTVTVGNSATTTEVISDSFTGTDYSGAPTAVSEPITLAAILDKWNNSAGSPDWKVTVSGVATNLSAAIASFAGLFFNVKDPTYGALGDGATDDTNAINAAITAASAAGGGIVFFPQSTSFYRFTTLTISAANITLMGVGPAASILKSASTSADLITFTNNTSGAWKRIIGLGIEGTGGSANEVLAFEETQQILIDNCQIICSSFTGSAISRNSGSGKTVIFMRDSTVTIGASTGACLLNLAADGDTVWNVCNCRFIVPASYSSSMIEGPNFNIDGCVFDASAVTSGTYYAVNATSQVTPGKYICKCTNTTFLDGGSTGFAFQLASLTTGSDFYESGNVFEGFTAPAALTSSGQVYNISHNAADSYKVYLGSRAGRVLELSNSSTGTLTPSAITAYEHLFITHTGAGNVQIDLPTSTMVAGSDATIIVFNSSGAQRDIVLNVGESVQTYSNQSGTSGTDITTQPGVNERSIFKIHYSHNGSGSPLALVITGLED